MHSKEIEQLKRELAIERIAVSSAVAELIQYTQDNKVCVKVLLRSIFLIHIFTFNL